MSLVQPERPTAPAPLDALLELFAAAPAIWYSSVRSNGRAHLAPIWHVWDGRAAYVVTQANSVRARNLAHNGSVSLALPDPMNAFIMEGDAQEAPTAREAIAPLFQKKYDWNIGTDAEYGCIIRVAPAKALAWGSHGEGRWRYNAATALWAVAGST
jgi:hypothetical protein